VQSSFDGAWGMELGIVGGEGWRTRFTDSSMNFAHIFDYRESRAPAPTLLTGGRCPRGQGLVPIVSDILFLPIDCPPDHLYREIDLFRLMSPVSREAAAY